MEALLVLAVGPLASAAMFGQAAPDPVSTYAPLGVAGLICTVLTVVWLRAEHRAEQAEERERRLNEKVMDRVVPLLTETSRVLSEATHGMSAAMERSRLNPSRVEEVLADLQSAVSEIRGHE